MPIYLMRSHKLLPKAIIRLHFVCQYCYSLGGLGSWSGQSLSVEDNGAGIAPEALPHIFERFYRGDASRHQSESESGLGLAIAKSLVKAHGGTITATSNGVGKGSMISVRLPE